METSLEIVVVDGEHRIDSRLVTASLGIEHEVLIRTLRKYEHRLETLGVFRFQNGKPPKGKKGGRPEVFVLLNEDQSIFAATLSRNTEQVVDFKLKLTKAFSLARQQLRSQVPASQPQINSLWEKRAQLFNEKTRIPEGYWCVFNEIAHVCWGMEFRGEHLQEDAVPDISVGLMWMKEIRRLSLDERLIRKYPHHYPDKRRVQVASIYPNAWLGAFRDWFQRQYLKQEFRLYVQKHARILSLPEGQ